MKFHDLIRNNATNQKDHFFGSLLHRIVQDTTTVKFLTAENPLTKKPYIGG